MVLHAQAVVAPDDGCAAGAAAALEAGAADHGFGAFGFVGAEPVGVAGGAGEEAGVGGPLSPGWGCAF